jgi:plastocyanin
MHRFPALLCACLALALVAAGCGSDNKKSSNSSNGGGGAAAPAKTTTSGGGSSAGGGGKSVKVTLKNTAFNPATVTVAKGGTVTWTNEDSVGHDVTAKDGSFKSGSPGSLTNGKSYSYKFAKAGNFKYVCTVHPGMEGDVTVK